MAMNTLEPDPEFTLNAIPKLDEGPRAGGRGSIPRRSIKPFVVVCALILAIGIAALYFLWPRGESLAPNVSPAPLESTRAPQVQPEPAVAHPVENIPAAVTANPDQAQAPLPALDASDNVAKDVIGAILNDDDYVRLLVPTSIIRHIVATIDNLPRTTVAVRINPIKPATGSFATAGAAGGIVVAEGNAQRYAAYIKAAESIDTKRLVGFYVRLYPLFQQAYVELGYPHGYFNDRLVSVIDHLLATPEPMPPLYLVQPRVRFEFADPELEAMSAGQKILVRIGIDNELHLKTKLREIRHALTAQTKRP